MIQIENLSKVFRTSEVETIALNHVNIEVKEGEFVAIMGPSGCGKSTLLNILGLLDNPTEGSYKLLGNEVANLKEKERTRLRKGVIGFVFQSFNLIDELNVFENVELPLTYLGIKASERKERVLEILKRMNLSHRAKHFPQQLSGGGSDDLLRLSNGHILVTHQCQIPGNGRVFGQGGVGGIGQPQLHQAAEVQLGAVDLTVHTVVLHHQRMNLTHDAHIFSVNGENGTAAGVIAGVALLCGVLHGQNPQTLEDGLDFSLQGEESFSGAVSAQQQLLGLLRQHLTLCRQVHLGNFIELGSLVVVGAVPGENVHHGGQGNGAHDGGILTQRVLNPQTVPQRRILRQTDLVKGTGGGEGVGDLALIQISEPTRRTPISYAVFCLNKKKEVIA